MIGFVSAAEQSQQPSTIQPSVMQPAVSPTIPLLPMTIIGQPSIVNGKLCTQDTVIEAVLDGKVQATRNCNEQGRYTLAIVGEINDAGKEILFVVDGIQLPHKESWQSGKVIDNFSFAISRALTEKELQALAAAEQKQKDEQLQQQQLAKQVAEEQQKQTMLLVAGIIVLALIIIAGIFYFLMKQKNKKSYKQLQRELRTTAANINQKHKKRK